MADHLNLSVASVSYWKTGEREVPAKYCKMIEQFTNGKVTVKDLRPDDWKLYWG